MKMDNKLKYDFQRICRICLSETSDTTNLFDSSKNIYEIIMTCSDVKLTKDDGLPTQICNTCSLQADNAFNFKQQCEQSDAKLRYYINTTYPFSSNDDVKEEQSLLGLSDINDYFKYESHTQDSILTSPSLLTNSGFQSLGNFSPKYECAICKGTSSSSEKLVEHVISCHSTPIKIEDVNYICSQCKRKCSSDFYLKKHEANHKTLVTDGEQYCCPICRDNLPSHDAVLRHVGQ